MLYDATGRPLADAFEARPPDEGTHTVWQTADRELYADAGRALTPERIDRVMRAANSGDSQELAALASILEEACWTAASALQTRRLAVAQTPWSIVPGDDTPRAIEAAERLKAELDAPPPDTGAEDDLPLDSFAEAMFFEQQSALLPGYSVMEVVWGKGGSLAGFRAIEAKHITFRNSRRPLLITQTDTAGMPLASPRFVLHRCRARSGDPARGGLVRPLAWMWCFQSLAGIKDLLGFTERYGMPFVMLRVDDGAYKNEKSKLQALVRNFGSYGGGVFTKAVEAQMIQAASSGGDVFFRLLDYIDPAIEKLVLGQLATGGEGGGLSGDNAQDRVRQDLRAADCEALALTNRRQLFAPWTLYNFGADTAVPKLEFDVRGREDLKTLAETLATLRTAGYRPANLEDVSDRFGMTLVEAEPPGAGTRPPGSPGRGDVAALQAEVHGLRNMFARLAQPGRKPAAPQTTLVGSGETSLPGGGSGAAPQSRPDEVADSALAVAARPEVLAPMFGPLQAELDRLAMIADDAEFIAAAQALVADSEQLFEAMDPAAFERALVDALATAAAYGAADRAAQLAQREGDTR